MVEKGLASKDYPPSDQQRNQGGSVRLIEFPKIQSINRGAGSVAGRFFPYCEEASISNWMPSHGVFSQVFLAVAHKAKVDALVSVEKDLLALRGSFTPPILTVEELRKRLQEERLA